VTTAEWILRAAFKNCRHVPLSVQGAALRYLRVTLQYPDGEEVQATRQLMGSLLCFPLLCLQNYLAFRYVFGPDVPVRINGDDIVFRSSMEGYKRWAQFVASTGLVLSPGKTLVDPSTFSLNSTFFYATDDNVRLVPVVRCCSLLASKSPYPSSLAGTLRGFLEGFRGELRDALGSWFLRKKKRLIRGCGRSVGRGLGMSVTESMLKSSDLWYRELWYMSSVPARYDHALERVTEGIPLPEAPDRLEGQVKIPSGWRRCVLSQSPPVRAKQRRQERDFWELVTDASWGSRYSPREVEKEYWQQVKHGSFETQFYNWRTARCPAFAKAFIRRMTSVRNSLLPSKVYDGPRSRLSSRALWAWLTRPEEQRRRTVWQWVGEEVQQESMTDDEYECNFIRVKRSIKSVYFPKCPEWWLSLEAAADSYVQ